MFQKARESSYLESTSLLVLAIRWIKPLCIVTILGALCALIFSGENFITPKFKSTVVLFPAATNSISKSIMQEHTSDKQDILAFGEEEQAEQMLQVLNSDEIREIIIRKYHLMQHYKIDSTQRYPMTALIGEFNDNISFQRTEFMSVKIDVMDADPEMAAMIANDIAALLDSMEAKIQRERALHALVIVENSYKEKVADINRKEDSLRYIRQHGVTDYRNQALIWNEEYAKSFSTYNNEIASLEVLQKYRDPNDSTIVNTKARIKGAEARLKSLQVKIDNLADFGGASISLNEELSLDRESLSKLKEQFDKLKVDAMQTLPYKFVVNKAMKAEKKSYPVRWLIVVITSLCAFILAFITLLAIDKAKEIRLKI